VSYLFCPRCAAELEARREVPEDPERPTCPKCGFVHYENPAPTVQGWIERDGRYLLLRRAREPRRGIWNLPGGFVEPFEAPEEAVRREVAEETGLEIQIKGPIGAFPSPYADTGRATLDLAYLCRLVGGELVLSEESDEAEWFEPGSFPELAFEGERLALQALRNGDT
jgi:ADP-ribose pyrophosphatase YjhB (NUDIX family)